MDRQTLEAIFTLARVKQVELTPHDEQALIAIIEAKKSLFEALDHYEIVKQNELPSVVSEQRV